MKGNLFVSYSYTGKIGNQSYQGFGNDVLECPNRPGPVDDEDIEDIQKSLKARCCKELGLETAVVNVLWWKVI